MNRTLSTRGRRLVLLACFVVFLICFLCSFFLGKFHIPIDDFFKVVASKFIPVTKTWDNQIETILFKIRFPRIVMGAVIGAGISMAGATYQALFQNPMISQDVLGASQGAAFGAAIALFMSWSYSEVIGSSFIFGLISVALVLLISRMLRTQSILNMVLIGMMIGSLFSSAVSFLKLVGDPTNTLPAITYWLMGSLSGIKMKDVYFAAPLIIIGMIPIILCRWQLNLISLGEEEAAALGMNVRWYRLVLIISATLITAAAVSVSGLIGWVGLVVPHFSRLLVGNNYRYSIPVVGLIGASFLLFVDNCSRLLTTSEIPIGILTSFIGAPIFIMLIAQNSKRMRQ